MKRDTLMVLLLFVSGVVLRMGFGILRPTEDLAFYLNSNAAIQFTRLGFEKSLLFYPLYFFDLELVRVTVLAVILSALNTIVAVRFLRNSNQKATSFLLLLTLVNTFYAQIDMHLVRQQIAIYLFLMVFSNRNFGIGQIILSVLSIAYHEVAALLFCGMLAARIIRRWSLGWVKQPLTYMSFPVTLVSLLQSGNPSWLFLLYTLAAFFFLKKESEGISLGVTVSIVILAITIGYNVGLMPRYLTPVALDRSVGVLVSLGLFRLVFDGKFQRKDHSIKALLLLTSMSLYGLLS